MASSNDVSPQHFNSKLQAMMAIRTPDNHENKDQHERLNIISDLYKDIGFHRKAAFYKRFAALQAVSPDLASPNWSLCYDLLIQSLEGYCLTLDPIEYEKRILDKDRSSGWTAIHVQLLQELVTTAKRMNNTSLAIRHLSFLLQSLSHQLSCHQKKDFASQLEHLSRRGEEGAPVPLNLQNGVTIPSVNLTRFPYVTSFTVKPLSGHLKPFRLRSLTEAEAGKTSVNSPFIFTPLQLNKPLHPVVKPNNAESQVMDFKWVEDETGSVVMQVYNSLPVDLHVDHMKLLTNGVVFRFDPFSTNLPPESGPTPTTITGTPNSSGRLEIHGYSTHVLGVKSTCLLKDLPHGKKMKVPDVFVVDVVPALPLLSLSCPDLDKSSASSSYSSEIDYITSNYALTIFAGESRSVDIFVSNSSSNPDQIISIINMKLFSRLKKKEEKQFVTLSTASKSCPNSSSKEGNNVCDGSQDCFFGKSNLPLAPGSSFEFSLDFYGFSDFVQEDKARPLLQRRKSGSSTPSLFLGSNSGISSPSSSFRDKSKQASNLQIGTALSNFLSKLQTPGGKSREKNKDDRPDSSLETYPSKVFDFVIEFEYSGGPGLEAGYGRKAAISFSVEILPSVVLTQWHVLQAEVSDRCYLVLDVLNATSEEMELKYSANKSILIEGKETCRVPVEIERCSLKQNSEEQTEENHISQKSLATKCKEHLIRQVSLSYTLFGNREVSGRASIESIPWSQFMLETILMSPVQWAISANGHLLPSDKPEVNCAVGELLTFSITLSNHSDQPLKYLSLWIEIFQDKDGIGSRNYDMDTKLTVHGKEKTYTEEIRAGDCLKHECSYIFLHSGQYKMEVQSSGYDVNIVSPELLRNNSSSSGANHYLRPQDPLSRYHQLHDSLAGDANLRNAPSRWKCNPATLINVLV